MLSLAILEYIYCNKVTLNEDLALKVAELSDKYMMAELTKLCDNYLAQQSITIYNVSVKKKKALQLNLPQLEASVVKFFGL